MPLVKKIAKNRRYLTRSEFARRVGVTPEAIYKAVNTGRIKTCRREGKLFIDWKSEGPKFIATSHSSVAAIAEEMNTALNRGSGKSGSNQMSISESRERQERYKALKMKMEYEERMGLLIETGMVQRDWQNIGTMIKKAVMSIADRVSPLVTPVTEEHRVHMLIEEECNIILQDLSSEIMRRKIKNPGFGDEPLDQAAQKNDHI